MKPWLPLLAIVPLALSSSGALADVPSAQMSTVDPCLVACPGGDIPFNIVVRHIDGRPVAGPAVVISYYDCPTFHLCALNGTESYSYDAPSSSLHEIGDNTGHATFSLRAGGACPSGTVGVYANGVILATRGLASPDQNGDGVVDGQDFGILQAKVGGADPTGDLNCDGAVTSADVALLQQHMGHLCTGPTPVRPGTWGRIKTIYR